MNLLVTYVHWGIIIISLPNLLLIVAMILVFALALVAPFPAGGTSSEPGGDERHE